jgi:hypothetical protein
LLQRVHDSLHAQAVSTARYRVQVAKISASLKCSLPLFRVRLARLMNVVPSTLDPFAPGCLWLLLKTSGTTGLAPSPTSWLEACKRRSLGPDFLYLAFKLAGVLPPPR